MNNSVAKIQLHNNLEESTHRGISIISVLYICLAFLYLIFTFIYPFNGGRIDWSVSEVLHAITTKCSQVIGYISGSYNTTGLYSILRNTAAVVVGAGLAVAGATFQSSFKNVLASPNILGVTSGSLLGNAIYLIVFVVPSASVGIVKYDNSTAHSLTVISILRQEFCSLVGSLVAMAVIAIFLNTLRKIVSSDLTVLFGGMAISAVFSSIISIIEYVVFMKDDSDDRLQTLMSLNMGTLDRVLTWTHLLSLLAFTVPLIVLLVLFSNKVNALTLADDEAKSMGINVTVYKYLLIFCACAIVATVVAFCGQIGLIGFLTPIVARRLVGNDMRKILVAAMPIGSILLLLTSNIASALNLSGCTGAVSSALGCIIMFIYLLKGRRT